MIYWALRAFYDESLSLGECVQDRDQHPPQLSIQSLSWRLQHLLLGAFQFGFHFYESFVHLLTCMENNRRLYEGFLSVQHKCKCGISFIFTRDKNSGPLGENQVVFDPTHPAEHPLYTDFPNDHSPQRLQVFKRVWVKKSCLHGKPKQPTQVWGYASLQTMGTWKCVHFIRWLPFSQLR